MTGHERIVDKLRRVMALTTSPVEGEAQAALATLQRLLEEYNLTVADLERSGQQAKPGVEEKGHDLAKAAFTWKLDLAEVLAEHYYCYGVVNRTRKTVSFVGRPENVDSLKALYGWVIEQIRRIASEERVKWHERNPGQHIDPLRWQLNFGLGVVGRIGERLKAERAKESSVAGTALAISHATEVSDYLEEKYGHRVDGRKTKSTIAWEAEVQAEREAKAKLKADDIDAYYEKYPWERPLTEEQSRARAIELEKADRAWEKKAARRKGRATKPMSDAEWQKIEQAGIANDEGEKSGDKVNLKPFLGQGGKTPERLN